MRDLKMFVTVFMLFLSSMVLAIDRNLNGADLKCVGDAFRNVSLSAYYPIFGTNDKRNHLDARGKMLNTLQDYLDGRTRYVTVAGNLRSGIPYGTRLCIEKLNKRFGQQISLEIRDQIDYGNDDVLKNDFSRLEICVRTEEDTYDSYVNDLVTIYV